MNRDQLVVLADRCERAELLQPDGGYKLDADIARELGWTNRRREGYGHWQWHHPSNANHICALPPAYTSSLDAAVTLVPEGMAYAITNIADGEYERLDFSKSSAVLHGNEMKLMRADAAGAALALTAAALRALAQKELNE